ncbi:hypothetical protein N9948_01780 [bacterium]|nr:hypothetical protein [bacterium]
MKQLANIMVAGVIVSITMGLWIACLVNYGFNAIATIFLLAWGFVMLQIGFEMWKILCNMGENKDEEDD